MISIKKVMTDLDLALEFESYPLGEKSSQLVLANGIYGAVRDEHELALAMPASDGESIKYLCSMRSQTDKFVMKYSIATCGWKRLISKKESRSIISDDYEKQLRKNAKADGMLLFQMADPEDDIRKDPTVTVSGILVEEESFKVFRSADFPSLAVSERVPALNIIREYCTSDKNFPVAEENKEELLKQLTGIAIRRSHYFYGSGETARCRAFMYEGIPYVATKQKGTDYIYVYAMVQSDENTMNLMRLSNDVALELREQAKKEFNNNVGN